MDEIISFANDCLTLSRKLQNICSEPYSIPREESLKMLNANLNDIQYLLKQIRKNIQITKDHIKWQNIIQDRYESTITVLNDTFKDATQILRNNELYKHAQKNIQECEEIMKKNVLKLDNLKRELEELQTIEQQIIQQETHTKYLLAKFQVSGEKDVESKDEQEKTKQTGTTKEYNRIEKKIDIVIQPHDLDHEVDQKIIC